MSTPLFTILIPTHDHADTLFHSVASALGQTIQDFEILVVGDGAPPRTAEVMTEIIAGDARIRYLPYAKGERHGERNRHEALKSASGNYVAYLADDDLWAPEHLETLLPGLESHDVVHTMHYGIFPDGTINSWYFDGRLAFDRSRMRHGLTGIGGLASGSHRMDAYRRLPEGWRPAPPDLPTDQYFWLQFLEQDWCRYLPIARHTAFHFDSGLRRAHDLASRVAELAAWGQKIRSIEFREQLARDTLQRMIVNEHQRLAAASPRNLGGFAPGRRLAFRQGAGNDGYLQGGFSIPEAWGCWTDGEYATVFLPFQSPPSPGATWQLRLTLQALVYPPQRPLTAFSISVNGRKLLEVEASSSEAQTHEIGLDSIDLGDARFLAIGIHVAKPVSPLNLGLSRDYRALGVGLVDCEISQRRRPLPAASPRYYFLHIPKTAGTSLNRWLADCGKFDVCPEGLWSLLLKRDKQELLSYSMFCGHFYRYLPGYLGLPLTTFTFLRDPLERALSHYEHARRDPHHYCHEDAMRLGSFAAFAADPATRPLVRNFQTRALASMFDPEALSKTVGAQAGRYPLERHLETADYGMNDEKALQHAKSFVDECAFVGIVERMDESAAQLAALLGIEAPFPVGRQNMNPDRAHAEAERRAGYEGLEELLWADRELYRHALERFTG